ncbi:ProQ/FINO family protein [Halomonas llamarensis]|uniref:ProQ/FINO family protein n=1 Tax=Halomonas llamarensis TaxID=2945104 RepID=A0ABT0SQL8_9GAMM|nr:ProQ/FINO family protein [Halomonas llamarensis]MCL7929750.1 ProQ/FINO family protein [Halomonas llamarensis]
MAARVMQLLDDLEARLEHAQREINVLKEENQRLKQKLEEQGAAEEMQAPVQVPSMPQAPSTSPAVERTPVAEKSVESVEGVESAKPPSPQELLQQWYKRYPNAFFKGHTKPLKVGIHQDLAEREPWSNKLIRRALANYVNLPRYAKAMHAGVKRIDLDGNAVGVVDQQAAQFAAEKRQHNAPADKKAPKNVPQAAPKAEQNGDEKHPKNVHKPRQKPKEGASGEGNQQVEARPLSLEEKLASLQAKFERP